MRIHSFFAFFPLTLDDNLQPLSIYTPMISSMAFTGGTLGHCCVCTKLMVHSETKCSLFCSVIFVMCLGAFIEQYWLPIDCIIKTTCLALGFANSTVHTIWGNAGKKSHPALNASECKLSISICLLFNLWRKMINTACFVIIINSKTIIMVTMMIN